MRYSSEHKAETRSRIVSLAAQQIRLKGPAQVAVTEVMASAGLTHGGFYAHFPSKDALVAEAVEAMFADAQSRTPALDDALADETTDVLGAFRTYLASYLSPAHRDGPERGCPLPALSTDMARTPGAAKTAFIQGFDKLRSRIEEVLSRIGTDDPRGEASAVLAQMVGAVGLARAVGNGPGSDAILQDTLTSLSTRLGL